MCVVVNFICSQRALQNRGIDSKYPADVCYIDTSNQNEQFCHHFRLTLLMFLEAFKEMQDKQNSLMEKLINKL
jgi:predicted transposase YdaD